MKKQLLTLTMLVIFLQAFSQNLKKLITASNGISNQFTLLQESQQVSFNLQKVNAVLGLDRNSNLVLKAKEQDPLGFVHYRFYQTYQGIPVQGSMYVIHTKGGKVISLSGSLIADFDADMPYRSKVTIRKEDAIPAALNEVKAKEYMWQDAIMEKRIKKEKSDPRATYFPSVQLVWYNNGDDLDPKSLRLAYRVDVYAKQPLTHAYYFIDAQTGALSGKEDLINENDATGTANTLYSGTQTIHSDQTGVNTYRLRDITKGNGIITLHGEGTVNGTDYNSSSSNWNLSLPDQNALDAHFGVSQTYTFYIANFNRNSVDNNGYALTSYVNESGANANSNAYWDGSSMHYGKLSNGNGVTGIDVTGHELTHGVTQNSCNLVYRNESGAMNESLSDIMGKSVQFWSKPTDKDWRLSNDMNWFIRDMGNPNAFSQPDTYGGKYWKNSFFDQWLDNGGVHKNSGVGNFMFYLLVDGGSGTNDLGNAYSVQGIGLVKADQIIYRSQTVYLTTKSKYADWRTACIHAAIDLYGTGSQEVKQVKNAWYAVGVGAAPATNLVAEKMSGFIMDVSATPNPAASSTIQLSYRLTKAGDISLRLVDASGFSAATYSLGTQQPGYNKYIITNVAALRNGYYYLVVEYAGSPAARIKILVSH